jgi:DNA invertase Pin-like site-specific DNA recombinase
MSIAMSWYAVESGKIQGRHRDRLAVVYVRQSTVQQTVRHQESTRLQYGLRERALELGWSGQRVLVIDDDLGKSGSSAEGRLGFQRLVAEVGLDHVGLVLGIEMSRLARSCRDWHQLLEVCAVFGTLIGDLDGIYDPTDYNDRLLLGLKGQMSEAESHVLKQRLLAGKRAKASRGELGMKVPMGYIRRPSGEVVKESDEQARSTIELVFDQFDRRGTIHGVLRYLARHRICLPVRVPSGPAKGELEWHRANRVTLSDVLHHPMYAGAYVYGRRPTDPRRKQPGRPATGRTVAAPEQWQVLIKDHYPAYIGWEHYERNLARLEANCSAAQGVPRCGPSLLPGLVICGHCGLRMSAGYNNNGRDLRYSCRGAAVNYGEEACQSLAGRVLDERVGQLVLQALEPAALELSLKVAEDLETERRQLHQHWLQRLERAHFEAERAARQYRAVEPENRLVARTLERQWEAALAAQESLKEAYDRFVAEQPTVLSAPEREAIQRLARDIPALWRAPTTTNADRQAIVRQLVERVVVTVQGRSEQVEVQVHWIGGHGTRTTLIRPVACLEQLSYYPQLLQRVAALHAQGDDRPTIAKTLDAEGWRPAKRRSTFTAAMVGTLLARQGLCAPRPGSVATVTRRANEWTLPELAQRLAIPQPTLYAWLYKGHLTARRDTSSTPPRWLIQADSAELERLHALRVTPRTWQRPKHTHEPT